MDTAFRIGESHRVEPTLNRIEGPAGSVQLEPKVMEVLQALAASPGRVLSKEQLITRVWGDTHVTDDVLTRSISELRRVLGDDAKRPRFIETIARRGYRLIAPVTSFDGPRAAGRRGLLGARGAAAAAVIAGALASVWFARTHGHIMSLGRVTTLPLNGLPGEQDDPAISPDGRFVAYVTNGDAPGARNLYLQQVASGPPLQLTATRSADARPTWSPDGRQIAFIRGPNDVQASSLDDLGIFLIAPLGGPERRIVPPLMGAWFYHTSLSWSPDGSLLAYSDAANRGDPYAIFVMSLANGQKRKLTYPPKHTLGDGRAAFTPDGKAVAFCRLRTEWVQDLFLAPLDGSPLRRLTFDNRFTRGFAWASDGSLVLASNRGGAFSLWKLAPNGGDAVPVAGAGEAARDPTVARTAARLAYVRDVFDSNIWTSRRREDGFWGPPRRTTRHTSWKGSPDFSPDGRRLAYASQQSGSVELWVSSANGSDEVALTLAGGPPPGMPRWSPDGRELVFETRDGGDSDIAVMDVDALRTRRVVAGRFDDKVPSWSRDGRTIYFASNRSGAQDWQIWKVPATGGEPRRVTAKGGFNAIESRDGQFLYYAKFFEPGLWRMPLGGGPEECVIADLPESYWGQWALGNEGIYFVPNAGPGAIVQYMDLRTRHRTLAVAMTGRAILGNAGLALSADGNSLAFVQIDEWNQEVMVVDNFR